MTQPTHHDRLQPHPNRHKRYNPTPSDQDRYPCNACNASTDRPRTGDSLPDISRQTYTVPEVAKILGIGRNTAYESCRNGEIPSVRIGGRVLVPSSAIDALLDGAA